MENTIYYHVLDLDKVGKIERRNAPTGPFLWNGITWVNDTQNIIMDRVMGYEAGDGIGHTDMLERIISISEEEALNLIA